MTSIDYVYKVLKSCKSATALEIAERIERRYDKIFQHNTIVKDLKFIRDRGEPLRDIFERNNNGSQHKRYWLEK